MSGPRRSNIYDLSSLRLRPDGTRLQQSKTANTSLRYAAVAVQDTRGNWFSQDASGPRTVGKYRNVREGVDGEVAEPEEERMMTRSAAKGKERERIDNGTDPRSMKRRKFLDDFDFIAPDASISALSLPSSDLLKSIHYFASNYYHERGQLLNVTKEYRRMRKVRELSRTKRRQKVEAAHEDVENSEVDSEPMEPVRRGGRIKGNSKAMYPIDMYRMFDGSALLAIGMLLEEYVNKLLEIRIPDGWEDMMREAGNETEEDMHVSDEDDSEHSQKTYADGNHEQIASGSRHSYDSGEEEWDEEDEDEENKTEEEDGEVFGGDAG